MAEVAINFALDRLRNQLEKGLDRSAGEEAMRINKEIDGMKGFLNNADWRRESDEDIEEWVSRARGLAHKVEDVVDGYRTRKARLSRFWLLLIKLCTVLPFSYLAFPFPESLVLFVLPALYILISSAEDLLVRYSFRKRLKAISRGIRDLHVEMSLYDFELMAVEERPARAGKRHASSSVDAVGMEENAGKVKEWLLEGDAEERVDIFIAGAMGTGKTTLASICYEGVKSQFDCHAWAFLSHPFQIKDTLKEVLVGFYESNSESAPINVGVMDEQELCRAISSYLDGKRYLLVLDDVGDPQYWNELSPAIPGSCGGKVVLTTRHDKLGGTAEDASDDRLCRSDTVAGLDPPACSMPPERRFSARDIPGPSRARELKLTELSDEDSMDLLCSSALSHTEYYGSACPEHLAPIAKEILSKCQGLPISIVTVGSLLSTKEATPEEWQRVLAQIDKHLGTSSEKDVFVSSGYADLPPLLKQCFLYCGTFPGNYKIPVKRLVRLWVAEGFAEEVPGMTWEETATQQMNELIDRNMVQIARVGLCGELESCRMLNLMSSFAQHMSSRDDFCIVARASGPDVGWGDLRRLSTEDAGIVLNKNIKAARKLRSLLYFGNQSTYAASSLSEFRLAYERLCSRLFSWGVLWTRPTHIMHLEFKMLRVMELHGLPIRAIPYEIGGLILLRYLGLRGTNVDTIPPSLLRLVELETLDIRQTKVSELPDLHYLRKLRHVYMEGSFMDRVVKLSKGVMWLTELQTLAGAELSEGLCEQLGYLVELRKLSVGKAHAKYSKELSRSINNMHLLRTLSIKCDWGEELDLNDMGDFRHLNKLKLGGRMDGLLNWVSRLHSLCYLYLWDSMLAGDPLTELKNLNNLVLLSLYNAFDGADLCCDEGGFPSLKKLSILKLIEQRTVTIAGHSMPELEKIFFACCPKLEDPPAGIEHLSRLQVIQLTDMPERFGQEASRMLSSRERRCKVQHIHAFVSHS